ncbi:MAG: bifunctional ADP-heptose synthase, partial [Planctomycetes bacterium]|nr:bifunctional ADP-heptose synthase [Planctomycetota bacterium]
MENLIEVWRTKNIGVVGDIVADIYVEAVPARLSREAPVIIALFDKERLIPGSAANTIWNIAALEAGVQAFGIVGDDAEGAKIRDLFETRKIEIDGLVTVSGRNTVTKTRFMIGDIHRSKQQVLRLDKESGKGIDAKTEKTILEKIEKAAPSIDAWIISDYGYGLITDKVLAFLLGERGKGKPVVADSRYELRRFDGVTALTPNEDEALKAFAHLTGIPQGHREEVIPDPASLRALVLEVGRKAMEEMRLEGLVITRGREGMIVFRKHAEPLSIEAYGDDEVVDVSGAGDTVTSVFTLALSAGADFADAARMANVAAGIVVRKAGAATVSVDELL